MLELRFGQPVLLQVLNKLLVLARLSASSILPSDQSVSPGTADNEDKSAPGRSTGTSDCADELINADHRLSVSSNGRPTSLVVPPCLSDEHQANLILSTTSFRRIISMVTGQDIQNFLDQWVHHSGHVRLSAKFHFNRKRNVVELELKQDLHSRGTLNYTGPLTVMLQELDGAFMHTFKLEEGRTSRDLPCHSKSRKHRKKKIPLANGDEVDMDLGRIDAESPLLWLRLDPDLAVIRTIRVDQPDFMWHLMLAHDRDCLGQMEAVQALRDCPSAETRHALASLIANDRVFYRVRMDACYALCHIANEMSAVGGASGTNAPLGTSSNTNAATSCLFPIFWQLFSSPAARGLIRQNNFQNLQHYFLMRTMIRSLATLRVQQVCPREVLSFVTDLLRQNDNSRNAYSDCYYRADLIKTLKDTLTPAIVVRGVMSASSLPVEARTVVEEVAHHFNLDSQIMSYRGTVTVACLAAVRRLQRLGFLPVDPALFYHYASPGLFHDLRVAGLEALVDYIRGERDQWALDWIFDEVIERDEVTEASYPRLRFEAVQLLIRMPPFQRGETGSRLDTPQLVERLWTLMNYGCAGDSRLRSAVADLYHILYGNRRPTCLPLPEGVLLVRVKEGRSVLKLSEHNAAGGDPSGQATDQSRTDHLSGSEVEGRTRRGRRRRRRAPFAGSIDRDADLLDEEDDVAGDDFIDEMDEFEEEEEDYEEVDEADADLYAQRRQLPGFISRDDMGRPMADALLHADEIGDGGMYFSAKRSYSFEPLMDAAGGTEPPAKRRTQRLSDDDDDDD
ncbi:unnamed protein product [Echinostoma caproni]|uniref:Transcription initiation factor TFIID 150 kDa subunit n=1 Tax=Echinostoma caproni TaxID=27848 RepID=A0A183AK71_9TREM|nr:unnamed protein product [Echinostoma caproni]